MRPSSSSMARIFPSPHIVLQDMGREVQDRYTRVRGGGGQCLLDGRRREG